MGQTKGTQSINRVFDILEEVASEKQGIGVTELSKKLELSMSTVSRLVIALKERGYLYKDNDTNKLSLGVKCIELSSTFLNSLDLKVIAEEMMYDITSSTGETVFLALLQDQRVVYIDKTDSSSSLRRLSVIGTSVPFHCTSLGKALLLNKSKEHLRKFVNDVEFTRHTDKTIVDKEHFVEEVVRFSSLGYTVEHEENLEGVSCVGAPIFDCTGSIVAAMSITGETGEFTDEKIQEYGRILREKTLVVSKKLGYMGS